MSKHSRDEHDGHDGNEGEEVHAEDDALGYDEDDLAGYDEGDPFLDDETIDAGIPADSAANGPPPRPGRFGVRFARFALILALAAALLGAAAGFGTRLGLWQFGTGFDLLRWAVYGAIAGAVVSAVAVLWSWRIPAKRGLFTAFLGLAVSLVVLAIPLQQSRMARGVPPIHDISTDLDDPPEFVAVAPLRADASNPVEYAGEETARMQREAYPDIRPLILDLPPERAFERALVRAVEQGWTIVDEDAGDLRIEATARTFWFGFRDDVVIRLTPLGERTVVDVRSKSRVGRGDAGANARRIRAYLEALAG